MFQPIHNPDFQNSYPAVTAPFNQLVEQTGNNPWAQLVLSFFLRDRDNLAKLHIHNNYSYRAQALQRFRTAVMIAMDLSNKQKQAGWSDQDTLIALTRALQEQMSKWTTPETAETPQMNDKIFENKNPNVAPFNQTSNPVYIPAQIPVNNRQIIPAQSMNSIIYNQPPIQLIPPNVKASTTSESLKNFWTNWAKPTIMGQGTSGKIFHNVVLPATAGFIVYKGGKYIINRTRKKFNKFTRDIFTDEGFWNRNLRKLREFLKRHPYLGTLLSVILAGFTYYLQSSGFGMVPDIIKRIQNYLEKGGSIPGLLPLAIELATKKVQEFVADYQQSHGDLPTNQQIKKEEEVIKQAALKALGGTADAVLKEVQTKGNNEPKKEEKSWYSLFG